VPIPALIEDPNDPGTYLIQTIPDNYYSDTRGDYSSGSGGGYVSPVLSWSKVGERFFEAGVDHGVLYLADEAGVVWNGLIKVSENPSGGESKAYYIDGYKYAEYSSPEEFQLSIEAYTYPEEFTKCDGTELMANGLFITQQRRHPFGLSYRTKIGNDVNGLDHGYKIHLIYNAMAIPSQKDYESFSDSTDPSSFSWDVSTRPKKFEDPAFGVKYGSHLVLDSTKIYPWAMEAVEKVLYGTETSDPRLPEPQELLELFVDNALLQVEDNGDGTWTITGPDDIVTALGNNEFQINWDSVIHITTDDVQISSL
jgi:hypothetical protein